MSNYTQVTFFAPKDGLVSGNPAKLIRGADVDPELAAIAVAIATKYDSTNISGGQVPFGAGTAAAPSITFAAALGTGLYLSAANTLGITANGAAEASFKGGMQLGAPTGGAKGTGTLNATGLYLNGAAVSTAVSANPSATIGLAAVNGSATTFMTSDSAPPLSQAISPTWTGTHTFSGAGITTTFAGKVVVGAPSSGAALTVSNVSGGQGIVVANAASGNVGLRVTDPGAAGSILELKTANLKAIINSNWSTTATSLSFQINSTEYLAIGTGGNVTIAAPSSGTPLAITTAAAGVGQTWTDGTRTAQVDFGGSVVEFGATSNHTLNLYTNNSTRLSIAAGGNVTVNAPSSGTALTVNGLVNTSLVTVTDGTQIFQVQTAAGNTYSGASSNHAYNLITNNTTRIGIVAAGNVTVNAPSSGVAATINGVSGTHSTKIADSATNLFNAGYLEIPQNAQGASYATVLSDSSKHIYHNSASAHTFTINDATVNYNVGTAITFINEVGGGAVTIALQTTAANLIWSPSGGTGNRTLAAVGVATATKVLAGSPGTWFITGTGLT